MKPLPANWLLTAALKRRAVEMRCPETARMVGKTYGDLLVLDIGGRRGKHRCVVVQCSCGAEYEVQGHTLRYGYAQRCRACHDARCARLVREEHSVPLPDGQTVATIAAASGLKLNTVYRRWLRGWPVEKLGAPLEPHGDPGPKARGGEVDLPERRRTVYPNHGSTARASA